MSDEWLAEIVVLNMKAALAPLLPRLDAIEKSLAMVTELRDRVVAVETKAALPVEGLQALRERVDAWPIANLVPLQERQAATEVRLEMLGRVVTEETKSVAPPEFGDVRDRLVALETKTSMPSLADAAVVDLKASLVAIEERVAGVQPEIAALRERTAVLEVRSLEPGPQGLAGKDGPPGLAGKDGVDGRDGKDGVAGPAGKDGDVTIGAMDDIKDLRDRVAQLEPLRERVAVVEVRAQVPGPAGKDGEPGKDGLGWDDLSVVQESERAFTIRAARGIQVKELGTFTMPVEIYRGVYKEGQSYERGDTVTWAGSEWHCNEDTTTKPGDGSKAYSLKVKRGRDGKDGKDGKDGEPGRPGRDLTKDDSGRTW